MNRVYGGLDADFWRRSPLIGMVHLGPLPGSARADESNLIDVLDRAIKDAIALQEGGVDAIMVENFFDAPFAKDHLPPHTIAALTRAVLSVRDAVGPDFPIGVNALRNDARSALAIAHICEAQFVRVNVYVGAAVTDQGIIEGAARTATLYRRELGANVAIFADVFVKHAATLGATSGLIHEASGITIEDAARDAVERGLADALIVSGAATGSVTSAETVRRVAGATPGTPVLIGSGFSPDTARELLKAGASGAIVGTYFKQDNRVAAPVERERVQRLRAAIKSDSQDNVRTF